MSQQEQLALERHRQRLQQLRTAQMDESNAANAVGSISMKRQADESANLLQIMKEKTTNAGTQQLEQLEARNRQLELDNERLCEQVARLEADAQAAEEQRAQAVESAAAAMQEAGEKATREGHAKAELQAEVERLGAEQRALEGRSLEWSQEAESENASLRSELAASVEAQQAMALRAEQSDDAAKRQQSQYEAARQLHEKQMLAVRTQLLKVQGQRLTQCACVCTCVCMCMCVCVCVCMCMLLEPYLHAFGARMDPRTVHCA